jgi:hypothetical protein
MPFHVSLVGEATDPPRRTAGVAEWHHAENPAPRENMRNRHRVSV